MESAASESLKRPTSGIAVDASHLTSQNRTDYQGVNIATGEVLFEHSLGANKTINQGEFLAIVHAAQYIIENDFKPRIIYSDSVTAISWFKNKATSSGKDNPALKKSEVFLKALDFDIKTIDVRYWSNKQWGETPADFGRKSASQIHATPESAL